MAVGMDGSNAGGNLSLRLEEACLFAEWHGDLLEQLEVLFASLPHGALSPEVELNLPEDHACIGIGWLTIMHQTADVVGVAMRNHNGIHLLWRISCSHDEVPKVACRGHAPPTVAGIEQDQLLAGVHERGNEVVFEIACR